MKTRSLRESFSSITNYLFNSLITRIIHFYCLSGKESTQTPAITHGGRRWQAVVAGEEGENGVFFQHFLFFYLYVKKKLYFCSRNKVEPKGIE
jgi:hypothetical protein